MTQGNNQERGKIFTIEKEKKAKRIEYDVDSAILMSDEDAKLMHYLGNPHRAIFVDKNGEQISKQTLEEGAEFLIAVNRDIKNAVKEESKFKKFKILKTAKNTWGFEAAIVRDMSDGRTILWADGSKGFKNVIDKENKENRIKMIVGGASDWVWNDGVQIGLGLIFSQLRELKKFADEYMQAGGKIDEAIGVSMMGIGVSMLAFLKEFENVKVRAYSGTLNKELYQALMQESQIENSEWKLNNLNGENLTSFINTNEPLTELIRPYRAGKNKIYMKERTNITSDSIFDTHGAEAYFNYDGVDEKYYEVFFYLDKYPKWEELKNIHIKKSEIGSGIEAHIDIFLGKDEHKLDKFNAFPIKDKQNKKKNDGFQFIKSSESKTIQYNENNPAKNEEIKEKARQEGGYTGFAARIEENYGIQNKEGEKTRENFTEELLNYVNNLLNKNEKVITKKQENEEIETASFVNPFIKEDGFIDFNGKALKFIIRYIKENIENDKEFNSFNKKAFVFIKNGEINIIDENKTYELFSKNFCKDGIETIKNRSNLRYGNEKYIYETI